MSFADFVGLALLAMSLSIRTGPSCLFVRSRRMPVAATLLA
jgi:hypothetical protein